MRTEVLVLGAGGAGMMCAIHAGRRGRKVTLLDHAKKVGGKILISGGGRCNFTNLGASPAQYVSQNPHFMKSALSRYPSREFIGMVEAHGIPYHEKKLGQLFCDGSAQAIVDLLKAECSDVGAEFQLETEILKVEKNDSDGLFTVQTSKGEWIADSLVVATGGLSIPKIGATGVGYEIAQRFGLKLVERAAALDGFTLGENEARVFGQMAGLSLDVVIRCNESLFRENILFTHAGLSGPAALQASLHWYAGDSVSIDLLPERNAMDWFLSEKRKGNRSIVRNILSEVLPRRFAEAFTDEFLKSPSDLPLPQVSEKALQTFCEHLHQWCFIPSGTVGYNKAEVTRGGVDTAELSSKTMEVKQVPGLYFIGEVVDVTGWLGGYNFQWAWASGWAAGQVV
jgi:predicted Rossmann fold flavoprotein